MKKRLHDQKAGIAILTVLVVLSALEVVFRFGCLREIMFSTANSGEPFATAVFAALLLVFTIKGKDRICYICYGVWIGCFVLDQIIGLPGMIADFVRLLMQPDGMDIVGDITIILRILSMVTIAGIGVLLVEYMNDGSIYNKMFNFLCLATIWLLAVNIIISINAAITVEKYFMLDAFNCMYRLVMVFLSTFFAYDSAKMQLKKIKISK